MLCLRTLHRSHCNALCCNQRKPESIINTYRRSICFVRSFHKLIDLARKTVDTNLTNQHNIANEIKQEQYYYIMADEDELMMAHATMRHSNMDEGHDGDDDDEAFHTIKVKPALKKSAPDHAANLKSEKKGLKWDEKAIEEYDLLRGTRMKIDEPKTPYTHYDSGQESDDSRRPKSPIEPKRDALSWDSLQNRLDTVAAVRAAYPSSPSSSYHSDNEDERKKEEMRQIEFKEHRKRHYNEMELVRKFRQEHPDGVITAATEAGDDTDENFADDEEEGPDNL